MGHAPTTRRRGPSDPHLLGAPSYLCVHPLFKVCCRTTKLHTVSHMRRGRVFKWSVTPQHQGAESQSSPILGFRFYLCIRPLSQNYKIWRCNTMYGKGLGFKWLAMSPPQRGGVPVFPNFGVPFYLCVHPLSQNYQNWCSNTCLGVLWGQPSFPSQESGVPAVPVPTPVLGVLPYLCLHPLAHNNQIRNGYIYVEVQVFRRSATPLRLHKCVLRSVSNSRVSSCQYSCNSSDSL